MREREEMAEGEKQGAWKKGKGGEGTKEEGGGVTAPLRSVRCATPGKLTLFTSLLQGSLFEYMCIHA